MSGTELQRRFKGTAEGLKGHGKYRESSFTNAEQCPRTGQCEQCPRTEQDHSRNGLDNHRPTGFQIGTAADPNQDYEVRYGYDHVNRLSSVAAQGYWFEYEYDYLENSTTDRLHKTRAPFIKETEWTYEPGRDTITSVTNRVGFHLDQQISQYTYENNADAQRTARTSTQAGNTWTDHFSYDPDTGGITASNPDTKEREPEAYQYDKIGNRLEATKGTQHLKRQHPTFKGTGEIMGKQLSRSRGGCRSGL